MHAHAQLTAAAPVDGGPGARITRMVSAPPIGWRPTPEGVYLVGTAAGPLGFDQVVVDVDVQAGAELVVRSAAATVLWAGEQSRQRTHVRLAAGASLHWQPEPIIATARCCHAQHAEITLAAASTLVWCEELLVGRDHEPAGTASFGLDVTVDGTTALRHRFDIGARSSAASPAVLGQHRAAIVVVVADPGARLAPAAGPGWAVQTLAACGSAALVQSVGADLADARARMAQAWAALAAPGLRNMLFV